MKQLLYDIIAKNGIKMMFKLFPDHFAKQPLKPSSRYLEYPFAIKHLPPAGKVLDAGCAGSFFPLTLAAMGYNVIGLDKRPYDLLNNLRFENFYFVDQDIRKTFYIDNVFDAVTAISSVEHIGLRGRYGQNDDPLGDITALREIKRILKLNGVCILTVPFGQAKIIKPYLRIYDTNQLNLLTIGFEIEVEEYYCLDKNGDWWQKPKGVVEQIDVKLDMEPVALLKLRKLT